MNRTEIISLGKFRGNLKSLNRITIQNGPFKTLGVWFSRDRDEVLKPNLNDRIVSMNKLKNIWRSRKLSLKGKVIIIRILILPQIQFLFSIVYTPKLLIKEIDTLLFKYLWDNKTPQINRNTIIAPIEEGGINMVDVFAVHTTAKCGWVRRLLSEIQNGKWKNIMHTMLNITSEMLNRDMTYSKFTKCKSDFHIQIMSCWNELHNSPKPDKTLEILNQNILYNQAVKIW